MPIVNDVAVDWDAVRGRLASADEAASRPRACLRTLDSALAEAAALVQPAIAYSVQPVVGASAGRLIVGDGTPLESPVVAALFGGAPDVVLMVFTIGPLLEARVAEHSAANDPARARLRWTSLARWLSTTSGGSVSA